MRPSNKYVFRTSSPYNCRDLEQQKAKERIKQLQADGQSCRTCTVYFKPSSNLCTKKKFKYVKPYNICQHHATVIKEKL